eukprot:NODE_1062_length_1079_cov_283.570874_g742_i0.p2 GENE.NODE_1062_length_1079_cov_283.570874_g742_i0~~NODE_1062_length_1079_cov_283.570874_g742_i0.p2  ORF type:complete len:171 (-),score=40.62 NODE_1062_length_1079_cov_283.570874_g742_i0:538-1050(-)
MGGTSNLEYRNLNSTWQEIAFPNPWWPDLDGIALCRTTLYRPRQLPRPVEKGEMWAAYPRAFMRYLFCNPGNDDIALPLAHTFIPDETVLQTLFFRAGFSHDPSILRQIWDSHKPCGCLQGNESRPCKLCENDLPYILEDPAMFFARKFDIHNESLMAVLEEKLHERKGL